MKRLMGGGEKAKETGSRRGRISVIKAPEIKRVERKKGKTIKGFSSPTWGLCSYSEHIISTALIDDSTRGRLEGIEGLELSSLASLHPTVMTYMCTQQQQNCCYTNQTPFSPKACQPGSQQINRLSKHITERIHPPRRAMSASTQLKQDKMGKTEVETETR